VAARALLSQRVGATLKDVVATYNAQRQLGLNGAQVNDLAEYPQVPLKPAGS
jgi:hypothetical protein